MVLVLDTTWQAMMDTYRNEVASKRCGQYFFSVHASPGVFFFFFFFFCCFPVVWYLVCDMSGIYLGRMR